VKERCVNRSSMPYTLTKTENITKTSYIGVRTSFL